MSAEQILAQKKLFARDRKTQLLSVKQAQQFYDLFDGETEQRAFEQWLSQIAFHLSRELQMIDHHKSSYDWYVYRKLMETLLKAPPWIIYQNEQVHTFTIVKSQFGGPWAMHDELNNQYGPMTAHMARMTNSSLNVWIFVNVFHTVSYQPKDYVSVDDKNLVEEDNKEAQSSKKKRKPKHKKEKRPVPSEWVNWPIRIRKHIPNIPVFQLPLLSMSRLDPGCNGNGPCDAFLNESPSIPGGPYLLEGSNLNMPNPEGLKHNDALVIASNKQSENMGKANWKYPDSEESLAEKEQSAILGFLYHMNEMSSVHVRCMHPRGSNKSTHTWNLKTTKFNKYEIYSGNVTTMGYQFWDGKCEPTVLFMAAGVPLNRIIPLVKYAARGDWYDAAFRLILKRMISRHPNYVKTQEDALVYVSDVTHATPGFSFSVKKQQLVQKPQQTNSQQSNSASPNAYVNWTMGKKIATAKTLMGNFFAHIGSSSEYLSKKAFFFAHCVHLSLLKLCGKRPFDLKDAYDNQRYDTAGGLLSNLNRRCWFRFMARVDQDLRNFIKDQIQIHWPSVFNEMWTNEITTSFVTGNMNPDKKSPSPSRKTATMRLQRYNVFGDISHSRRCNASNRSQRKSNQSRQIDNAQFGRRDTSDTPEGPLCGVVQTFNNGTAISESSSLRVFMRIIHDILGPSILEPLLDPHFLQSTEDDNGQQDGEYTKPRPTSPPPKKIIPHKRKRDNIPLSSPVKRQKLSDSFAASVEKDYVFVQVDGGFYWKTRYPEQVLDLVRSLRRVGEIDPFISCNLSGSTLSIRLMSGRIVRALISLQKAYEFYQKTKHVVKQDPNETSQWSYSDIMQGGIVDFMDAIEEKATVPAFSPHDFVDRGKKWGEEFTHMEIEQAWGTDSITSLLLPFADHNAGARKTLGNSFLKQAITNCDNPNRQWLQRLTAYNTQRSPCESRAWRDYDLRSVTCRTLLKAIVWNADNNQEDAAIFNETSKESLMFQSTRTHTYVTGNRKVGAANPTITSAMLQNANSNVTLLTNNRDKIDANSQTASLGEHVEGGDIIILRLMQQQGAQFGEESNLNEKMDDSVPLRSEHEGTVESTITVCNETNSIFIQKVIVLSDLANNVGDKFATFHGQKHTAGSFRRFDDLPFSLKDGQPGDVYTNVIGAVSRLTDGQQMDQLYTTYCINSGLFCDATSGDTLTRQEQRRQIEQKVLEYGGTLCPLEGFINGETGQLMRPLAVFIMGYAQLRHLVEDKYHTRGKFVACSEIVFACRGPRSSQTQQATDGRKDMGGLKTGPMERENYIACGAAHLLDDRLRNLSDPFVTAVCPNCGMPGTYDEITLNGYCELCMTGQYIKPVRTTNTTTVSFDELYGLNLTTRAKIVPEDTPITSNSSRWDPEERKIAADQRHKSMYKLSTMTTLDPSVTSKYGLKETLNYRSFLKEQLPPLDRKSVYTTTLTRNSSLGLQLSEAATKEKKAPTLRGRKRKQTSEPINVIDPGTQQMEMRNQRMADFLSMLAPVKRSRKSFNN